MTFLVEDYRKKEFLELYEPLHSHLLGYCRAISKCPQDAEDLFQDTLLAAWEQFGTLRSMAAFKSYLFRIACNKNHMRARRKKFRSEYTSEVGMRIPATDPDPEFITDFHIIHETMLQLPEKMANALILFHISDLTIAEIQKIQGGSISAVKQRLRRGKIQLLALLNAVPQPKSSATWIFTL